VCTADRERVYCRGGRSSRRERSEHRTSELVGFELNGNSHAFWPVMPNLHKGSSVIKGNLSCGCTHEHHRQSDRLDRDARLWHWSVMYRGRRREEGECSQHVRQLRPASCKQLACTWLCLPGALLPLLLSLSSSKMGRQAGGCTMSRVGRCVLFTRTLLGTPSGAVPGGGVAAVHCHRTVRTADW